MPLDFKSDLDDSAFHSALARMSKGAIGAANGIGKAFSGLSLGFIGSAGIGAAVIATGKSVMDLAGNLADTSAATGVTTDRLQGLGAAFAQSGVDAEKFRTGLTKSAEALESLRANADGPASKAIEKLGLTFGDVIESSPDEFILQISEGFSKAADKGAALTAVVDLLGKSGARMASGMSEGRESLEKFSEEAVKMSEDNVKLFDALGDKIGEFARRSKASLGNFFGDMIRRDFPGLSPSGNAPAGKKFEDAEMRARFMIGEDADLKKRAELEQSILAGNREFMERQDGLRAKQQWDLAEKTQEAEMKLAEELHQERLGFLIEEVKERDKAREKQKESDIAAIKDQITVAQQARQQAEVELADAQDDMGDFNRASPDERRQMNRDFLNERRAKAREGRALEARLQGRDVRDARAGAGRRLRAEADAANAVSLSDESITKLVDAIDKLVLQP